MYLFFDTLMMIYTKKPFQLYGAYMAHHVIGMISVVISSIYHLEFLFSQYINFEISTLFLNYYYIKKDVASRLLFFISFTIVRIIYGTLLLVKVMSINSNLAIIVIPFHIINYYWYYGMIKKFYEYLASTS